MLARVSMGIGLCRNGLGSTLSHDKVCGRGSNPFVPATDLGFMWCGMNGIIE